MYFKAISKWIVHKKPLPGCRTALIGCHACGLQLRAQASHVRTFEAEMTIRIQSGAVLFDRNMNVQAAGIEPDATAMANGLRLGNLFQPEQAAVKRPRSVLAAFGHGDVNVGEAHLKNLEQPEIKRKRFRFSDADFFEIGMSRIKKKILFTMDDGAGHGQNR